MFTIGAPERAVMVELDASRLASHGLAVEDLAGALQAANLAHQAGERVGADGVVQVTSGTFLGGREDVAGLVLGVNGGQPVRLGDVARITDATDTPSSYVWHGAPAGRAGPESGVAPAVTLAIAKKPGQQRRRHHRHRARAHRCAARPGHPEGVHVEGRPRLRPDRERQGETLIKKLSSHLRGGDAGAVRAWPPRGAVIGTAVVLTLSLTLFASGRWASTSTGCRCSR